MNHEESLKNVFEKYQCKIIETERNLYWISWDEIVGPYPRENISLYKVDAHLSDDVCAFLDSFDYNGDETTEKYESDLNDYIQKNKLDINEIKKIIILLNQGFCKNSIVLEEDGEYKNMINMIDERCAHKKYSSFSDEEYENWVSKINNGNIKVLNENE